MVALDRDLIVQALPAYEIGEEIGQGGSGVVLGGMHRSLGREVAIKQLPRSFGMDAEQRQRFVPEARLLASFDHPHIVPIFDYVEYEGICMLVMERLTGGTVWDRMHGGSRVSPMDACAIAIAACAGLHYAHQKGTLHRDVKPENLMFSAGGTLKITDFGIAKVMGSMTMSAVTQAGYVVGTPAYIAPEQAQSGTLGPETDVYALGTVLYELLARQLPYPEVTDQVVFLYQHVHEDPAPLLDVAPHMPATLAAAVDTAIRRDPTSRHRTAEDFGAAIAAAATKAWGGDWLEATGVPVMASGRMLRSADGSDALLAEAPTPAPPRAPVEAQPPDAPGTEAPPTRREGGGGRRRAGVVAAVAAVAVLGVGGGFLLLSGGDDPSGTDTTTTTASGDATDPEADATDLAPALAVGLVDLPTGFSELSAGQVIEASAIDDPCLNALPAPYVVHANGATFESDESGIEVSSTVSVAQTANDATSNAAAIAGDEFLACVRDAATRTIGGQIDEVTVERASALDVDGFVTSWVISARSGDSAAFVETAVLLRGRGVVTVNFSTPGRLATPEVRMAVLEALATRLATVEQ